ncbi:MAG: ABC transporter permease subunit [Betaproteobacteria bacterium]|nr:ABC transporter permease subunit [Betaproteobacteria bacterium]
MIYTIAGKELKSLFASPLAWVVLTFMQIILAFGFLKRLDDFMQIQSQLIQMPNPPGITELVVAPLFATMAVVLLFAVPLLAMRLIAEERRNQTMVLLVSAPLSMTEIVLGKFVGLAAFLLLIVGITTLMPLALLLGGRLDFGLLAGLVIGVVLLAACFAAVGLYASCLTAHPLVAAMIAFSLLLGMLLAGETAADGLRGRGWHVPAALAQVLSPLKNFEPFAKGMIDSYSLACMLLLIAAFLVLAIRRLDAARLRG